MVELKCMAIRYAWSNGPFYTLRNCPKNLYDCAANKMSVLGKVECCFVANFSDCFSEAVSDD